MSDDDLDRDLQALLRAAAAYSDMPEDAPSKLFARVSAGLGLPPDGGSDEGGPDGGTGSGAGHDAGAAHGGGAGAGVAKGASGVSASLWSSAKQTATLVAFGAGAVAGAAGHATYERATTTAPMTTTAPSVVATAPPPSVTPSVEIAPIVPASSEPAPTPRPTAGASVRPRPSTKGTPEDRELATERAQLEIARTALARGQADGALTTLRADAARRPNSRLAEERDSLTVQALALSGRTEEARAHAAAFAKKYPQSLFLPVVEAAIENDRGGPP